MRTKQELRTRKVTMAYKPSVYTQFQKIAYIQSTSPTQILASYMEQYVKDHQKDVALYDSIQKNKI